MKWLTRAASKNHPSVGQCAPACVGPYWNWIIMKTKYELVFEIYIIIWCVIHDSLSLEIRRWSKMKEEKEKKNCKFRFWSLVDCNG